MYAGNICEISGAATKELSIEQVFFNKYRQVLSGNFCGTVSENEPEGSNCLMWFSQYYPIRI